MTSPTLTIYYTDTEGDIQIIQKPIPESCIGDHHKTVEYIDGIMGDNDNCDNWTSYDIG